jgi:hypothetical protein
MPSPFPGMDPYLEGALWTTLHHGLGTEIVRQLTPKLRPNYIALPVERFLIDNSPDVSVEIRDTSQRRLVTAIEILSPTNKRGAGNQEYLAKRQRLLLSTVHLLEIDLLRMGERVPMQQPLPDAPYFVLLSRAEERPMTEVWPIALDQALPTVPVPLLLGDDDVLLDLQAAFTAAYDLPGYDLIIDYTQPPDVPFTEGEAEWVERHLHQAGLRA